MPLATMLHMFRIVTSRFVRVCVIITIIPFEHMNTEKRRNKLYNKGKEINRRMDW